MRKLSFYLLLLLLAVSAVPATAGTVLLTAPGTVRGPFDVTVTVTGVFDPPYELDSLAGFGFDVSYSPTLSYLGVTLGPLFTDFPGPHPGAQVEAYATDGFLNPGDFTEPLTLAVLHFGVVGIGPATIGISGDPTNPDQGLAYLGGADLISASTDVNAVPEPSTLALTGFAVALFAWTRRRSVTRP
jgi:hypothetical protein